MNLPFRNIWDNEQMMTELCKLFLWMWLKSNSLESEIKWMWKVPEAFQWRLDRNDFPDYYRPPLQKESLLRDKIRDSMSLSCVLTGQRGFQLCSLGTTDTSSVLCCYLQEARIWWSLCSARPHTAARPPLEDPVHSWGRRDGLHLRLFKDWDMFTQRESCLTCFCFSGSWVCSWTPALQDTLHIWTQRHTLQST